MPLTTSGKINRTALTAAEGLQPLLGTAYKAPATGLEKNIAQTWQKILNTDKVGIDDNFFDIGGNSLKVIRIVSELKEVLKRDIPVVTMFRYPTIRSLAKFLNQGETVTRKDRSRIKQKGRERVSMKRSLRTAQ
jgi:acyl carrier protein